MSALMEIGSCKWPDTAPISTGEVARRLEDKALLVEVEKLYIARFATPENPWSGGLLWIAYCNAGHGPGGAVPAEAENFSALRPTG